MTAVRARCCDVPDCPAVDRTDDWRWVVLTITPRGNDPKTRLDICPEHARDITKQLGVDGRAANDRSQG